MNKLPDEVILNILTFLPYDKNIDYLFYTNNNIQKLRMKYIKAQINNIFTWWKDFKEVREIIEVLFSNTNTLRGEKKMLRDYPYFYKKYLTNMYVFDYPRNYLYSYPEFFVEKIFRLPGPNGRLLHLPPSIKNMIKKRENINKNNTFLVYNFFKLKEVTNKDILHTGW